MIMNDACLHTGMERQEVPTDTGIEHQEVPTLALDDENLDMLARLHPHPLDARVVMDPVAHKYFLDGEKTFPISVTGVWASKFEKFDPEACVNKYFVGWSSSPSNKYFQLIQYLKIRAQKTDDEIKTEIMAFWNDNGNLQSNLGTHMHLQIERALNELPYEDNTPEMTMYHTFFKVEIGGRGWKPYRTEWSVFDEEAMVAGQIDSVFVDADGGLHMVDWKRCKDKLTPAMKSYRNRRGYGLCSHLLDTSYNHYCVQQNLYKYILQKNYGVHLRSMHLAQFHPNFSEYNFVAVDDMQPLAQALIAEHKPNGASPKYSEQYNLQNPENATIITLLNLL